MKNIFIFSLSFFTLTTHACYKSPSRQLTKLADRILNGGTRHSNPEKQISRLFKLWKQLPSVSLLEDDLSLTLSALSKKKTLPLLSKHEATIEKSIQKFFNTPGYLAIIKRLLCSCEHNDHHFNGVMYEITTAVQLEDDEDEEILEFGKMLSYNGKIREIDLWTTKRAIECKAWEQYPGKKTDKLKKQALAQKELVAFDNAYNMQDKEHYIFFKNTIPENLQTWLDTHEILSEEYH